MVCAVTFSGGRAHFRSRFVKTTAYVEEHTAERMLFRGMMGSQPPARKGADVVDDERTYLFKNPSK